MLDPTICTHATCRREIAGFHGRDHMNECTRHRHRDSYLGSRTHVMAALGLCVELHTTSDQLKIDNRPHFSPPAPNQANSPDPESSQ
eukprot:3734529-Prymnesium_polylepis.1